MSSKREKSPKDLVKSALGKSAGAERHFLVNVCRAQVSGEDETALIFVKNDLVSDLEGIALKYPQWAFLRAIITRLSNATLSDIATITQESRERMLNTTDYLYQSDKGTTKRCLFEINGLNRFCNSCPVGRIARVRYLELFNSENPSPLGDWGSK